MTTHTPSSVSNGSSPEAPSPSAATRTRSQTPSWQSTYAQLCPRGLDNGAAEDDEQVHTVEQPRTVNSASNTAAAAAAEEEQKDT